MERRKGEEKGRKERGGEGREGSVVPPPPYDLFARRPCNVSAVSESMVLKMLTPHGRADGRTDGQLTGCICISHCVISGVMSNKRREELLKTQIQCSMFNVQLCVVPCLQRAKPASIKR